MTYTKTVDSLGRVERDLRLLIAYTRLKEWVRNWIWDWRSGQTHNYFWHRCGVWREIVSALYHWRIKRTARFIDSHALWWNSDDQMRWRNILKSK